MPVNCRLAGLALAFAALLLTLGCSSEPQAGDSPGAQRPAATSAAATVDPTLAGIESAFARRNARARWEGSVLHVRMDAAGNDEIRPGWKECRVLSHLLEDGQSAVLELPDGPLQCEQVTSG